MTMMELRDWKLFNSIKPQGDIIMRKEVFIARQPVVLELDKQEASISFYGSRGAVEIWFDAWSSKEGNKYKPSDLKEAKKLQLLVDALVTHMEENLK